MNIVSDFDSDELRRQLIAGRKIKPSRDPKKILAQMVHRNRAGAGGIDFDAFEAYIEENDLVEINYLERGLKAARTICRINVPAVVGGGAAWGTGFLIGPRLLLTNNHVIPTDRDALGATVEFGYELDGEGRLKRTTRFRLTPQDGFVSSPRDALDYTIVAVAERSEDGAVPVSDLGFLRLDAQTGKTDVGQFVTIIQHPDANTKRIALRENKIVKYGDDDPDSRRDNFLWYSSDTAPGSSGAPVCNDAWQVVCLHHAGVPARNANGDLLLVDGTPAPRDRQVSSEQIKWLSNEGIRVSRMIDDAKAKIRAVDFARSPLLDDLIADATGERAFAGTVPLESIVGPPVITVPAAAPAVVLATAAEAVFTPRRNRHPANFFDGRTGYDAGFLGVTIPLPTVSAEALRHGPQMPIAGASDKVLRYTHFSVVFNGDPRRKLAFFTAVNIDGKRWTNLNRGDGDTWYYDPRLPEELQNGDELYGNEPGANRNYFDRGHLVRRLDPVWGANIAEATLGNDDTFQWTNCSPQYFRFNQGAELWQGLENFLLYNTDKEDVRASVFSGPVFRSDDEPHRGVLIPQFYWKVIAVTDKEGKLLTSGYMVSQQKFAKNIPFEQMPVGPNSENPDQNFQVPITKIEADTGIIFDPLVRQSDVYTGPPNGRNLRSLGDVEAGRR